MKRKGLCFLVVCMFFSILPVHALSSFRMLELEAKILIKRQGLLGNDEYFNGRGAAMYDDFKIMVDERTKEYVYCIEPGVNSVHNSDYGVSSINNLFKEAYNRKTSYTTKINLVSKLMKLIKKENRFDNGTYQRRIHYLVIQTLIWEVMCEERNFEFDYVAVKAGSEAITSLLSSSNDTYLRDFNMLYEDYEAYMKDFDTVPSFSDVDKNKADVILLDQFDLEKKEYYTYVKDNHHVFDFFSFTSDKIKIEKVDQEIKLSCKLADYSETVAGYNVHIRGYGNKPDATMTAHHQNNNQSLVSLYQVASERLNTYFKVKTINALGKLIIDPNKGLYNGSSQRIEVTKYMKETVEVGTPVRQGYRFSHWDLHGMGSLTNSTYTFSNGTGTLIANWLNEAPVIDAPIIPDDSAFIDDGHVIIQLGDKFDAYKYAKASDKEDGDISSKIKVKENQVVRDNNQITTKSGQYKVVYEVTDLGGLTTTKEITVIVNDPPVIEATDRYFFVGDTIDHQELLRVATANDKEDGNISHKLKVIENTIHSQVVGQYEVTFSVVDKYRKTTIHKINVYLQESQKAYEDKLIRYIDKTYISSLSATSKWKQNTSLNTQLMLSLSKEAKDNQCMYVFEWSGEDNEQLKSLCLEKKVSIELFSGYKRSNR